MTEQRQQQLQLDEVVMQRVLMAGDLRNLSPQERVDYYMAKCHSLGLNPLQQPFEYIQLSGKLTLYATKACTEQLRRNHGISIALVHATTEDGVRIVVARASTPDGRMDESTAAVPVAGLRGEAYANALMKCETKAKRRVTLSICGLGMTDESEVDSIPNAQRIAVSHDGQLLAAESSTKLVAAADVRAAPCRAEPAESVMDEFCALLRERRFVEAAALAAQAGKTGALSETQLVEARSIYVAAKARELARLAVSSNNELLATSRGAA